MKKKGPILKVKRVDLPDNLVVWDVHTLDSLLEMRAKNEFIVETDEDILLLKKVGLIRYAKPEARPRIIRIESFIVNTEKYDGEVRLSEDELLNFAKTMRMIVFETEYEFLIPSSTLFRARKENTEC